MQLNGIDDALALPIEMLKKANRLMRYGKATRQEIAQVIAVRVQNYRGYKRLEETDRISAVEWRLQAADPSHPSHERDWLPLLSFWRNRRHRQKIKAKREADPDFDLEWRTKNRERKNKRIAKDPEGHKAHVKRKTKEREAYLKEKHPAEWQRRVDRRSEVSRQYYQENKERLDGYARDRWNRLKEEDPEKWAVEYEKRKVAARESYQKNKAHYRRKNRQRRANRKAQKRREEANAHDTEKPDE